MNKLECLVEKMANTLDNEIEGTKKYKQFKQVKKRGLLTVLCPTCNKHFGLSTEFLEYVGELSYLRPYTCPYCSSSYVLKDE